MRSSLLYKPSPFVNQHRNHCGCRDDPGPARPETIRHASWHRVRDGCAGEPRGGDPTVPQDDHAEVVMTKPVEFTDLRVVPEQRQIEVEGHEIENAEHDGKDGQSGILHGSTPLMLLSTCPTRKLHQTKKARSHVR